MKSNPPTARILFIEGTADVQGSHAAWLSGSSDERVTHVAFSQQAFEAVSELGAEALFLCLRDPVGETHGRGIAVRNLGATRLFQKSGLSYHVAQIQLAFRIAAIARRFRADVVVTETVPHPFFLAAFLPRRIKTVSCLHCVLWPPYALQRRSSGIVRRLYGSYFRRSCHAVMAVSEAIRRQVRELAGPDHPPFVDFLPSFDPKVLDNAPPPRDGEFRILFAGRIERDKGIFVLLETARLLHQKGRHIVFDVCGSGSHLAELRSLSRDLGLLESFLLHGWCDQVAMRSMFARSSVVVVPTTTAFVEGFNMVVAEAVLAGRPVITSRVCPAIEYLGEACVEVPPDASASDYAAAIEFLMDQPEEYEALRSQTSGVAQPFLESSNGYGAALRITLAALLEENTPSERSLPPSGVA